MPLLRLRVEIGETVSSPVWVLNRTDGAVAQLGEHLLCKQGVVGSIPISSTNPTAHTRKRFPRISAVLTIVVPLRAASIFAIQRFFDN